MCLRSDVAGVRSFYYYIATVQGISDSRINLVIMLFDLSEIG